MVLAVFWSPKEGVKVTLGWGMAPYLWPAAGAAETSLHPWRRAQLV